MRIQTFRASSIQEALQLVRESLGPDASVLKTRQVRPGLFSKPLIEIEASRDLKIPSRFNRGEPLKDRNPGTNPGTIRPEGSIGKQSNPLRDAPSSDPAEVDFPAPLPLNPAVVTRRIPESSQATIEDQESSAGLSQWRYGLTRSASEVLTELIGSGVPSNLARELLDHACRQTDQAYHDDVWIIRGQIVESVAWRLSLASAALPETNEQRVMAFVGPTGAGKTSLLAKVAAQAHSVHHLEVGIVAVNSWRSGAAEQLLQLADSIEARIEAVSGADQLAAALQRLRECDLVMIDTAGRSPNDEQQMRGLHELLQIAQPDEVHLVLGANSAPSFARVAMERFARLGVSRLDITKVDEAVGIGQWLTCLLESPMPVMYLSHGSQDPQDLMQPSPRHLASILVGQNALGARSASGM